MPRRPVIGFGRRRPNQKSIEQRSGGAEHHARSDNCPASELSPLWLAISAVIPVYGPR
jgi:hypothetical protein